MAYRRVTQIDRVQIQSFLAVGLSAAEIARQLEFHKSSICREIKRNRSTRGYRAKFAQNLANVRFRRCRRRLLIQNQLEEIVIDKIKLGWSPDQLSNRLLNERKEKLSRQTIYNYIRLKRCLEPQFYKGLRRQKRKGTGRYKRRSNRREWMLPIKDRPAGANNRSRYGHWERDTMWALKQKKILVCVERKSRFTRMARAIEPICLNVPAQTEALVNSVKKKPLTITNDNGTEFWDKLRIPAYYCDPRKPQQRGTVENTIGLLRQYITRKTDLEKFSADDIKECERRLNHRPRKCLGYRTPYEVLYNCRVALVS